jgi:toxin ParE1/3/4
VRVHWTQNSLEHLRSIYAHIAHDSPRYAQRMVDRLTARSKQIGRFPLLGAVVPEYRPLEVREIIERPYRIIYRVRDNQGDVLAVLHGAQLLPPSL